MQKSKYPHRFWHFILCKTTANGHDQNVSEQAALGLHYLHITCSLGAI